MNLRFAPLLLSLLLSACGSVGPSPSPTTSSAPRELGADRTQPPRVVLPVARSIAGPEYELGAGRTELTIDADGWIARRGWTVGGRSSDDLPVARVVGDSAYDLEGAELARIDAAGRLIPVAFRSNGMWTDLRVDTEGFLVGWHGHRIDEDVEIEGDRARRRDLALANAATYLFPSYSGF
jgi:hypothetical protein